MSNFKMAAIEVGNLLLGSVSVMALVVCADGMEGRVEMKGECAVLASRSNSVDCCC